MEKKEEVQRDVRYSGQTEGVLWDQWVADLRNWQSDELTRTWRESRNNLTGDPFALPEMYAIAREKIRRWELRKE